MTTKSDKPATISDLRKSKSNDLKWLLMHTRFDLGTHKRTKLKRSGYRRGAFTLLDDKVAKRHALRLLKRFKRKWEKLTKSKELERLRFLTVLGSVEKLDVDAILQGVNSLEFALRLVLKPTGGIDVLGAFEVEIFSLKMLEELASGDDQNEQRKLEVLRSMMPKPVNNLSERENYDPSYALIHLHALVDLGPDGSGKQEALEKVLRKQLPGAYRVELKQTFENKPLHKNLWHIAEYLTKGGNETLRYNVKFGRDNFSADWLDHHMWRQGGGGDKKRNPDPDGSVEDSRSLSVGEIAVLSESIDKLMDRHSRREGYLFQWNEFVRYHLGRRRL